MRKGGGTSTLHFTKASATMYTLLWSGVALFAVFEHTQYTPSGECKDYTEAEIVFGANNC